MARLPNVGGDSGQWGQVLNTFLQQSHTDAGELKPGTVGTVQLQNGAVRTAQLADATITLNKISPEAVTALSTGGALGDGTVTTSKIADSAVTTQKIQGLGVQNGIATLDGAGTLPNSQLPAHATIIGQAQEIARKIYDIEGFDGATPELQLRTALAKFANEQTEVTLRITSNIVLTDTLTLDIGWFNLDFRGGMVDATGVQGKPAIRVLNSRTNTEMNTIGVANNRRFVRGLNMRGPGRDATGSIGILFESQSGGADVRGLTFYDHELFDFAVGHEFHSNAFLLTFVNAHIYRCGTGTYMPSGYSNYGENLRYLGGAIGSCTVAVQNENPNGSFHFVSSSIDFCRRAAITTAGAIEFVLPHIELNSSSSTITGPPFETGTNSAARIFISGGNMIFHDTLASANVDYLATTANTNWGGGVTIVGTKIYNARTASNFLCGGTGLFTMKHVSQIDGNGSGAGGGSVLTARALNLLIDGTPTLSDPVDIYVTSSGATNQWNSPDVSAVISNGRFAFTKTGNGSAEVSVFVPVEQGAEYAAAFTVAAQSMSGSASLTIREGFIASKTTDPTTGAPVALRSSYRSPSTITVADLATLPRTYAYGSTEFNRVAPGWATHFQLRIALTSFSTGDIVRLSEIIVTAR